MERAELRCSHGQNSCSLSPGPPDRRLMIICLNILPSDNVVSNVGRKVHQYPPVFVCACVVTNSDNPDLEQKYLVGETI